ncbi:MULTISPECIES: helix-turn-helix domain-containing protein [Streptomyces]|uniref:helix-turn-helix domain-containing protein n=1 Tax=Streptomyces TaxID=1883 RepID=UPI00163D2BC8|nr:MULTISPECIES: helix-turn-helix transcriptional regulator [Streptomyces]MBC2875385.1 helix-turn-helix domain-containing protein [Streptomyces sp. TYQ1024]UBI35627.1 helix-turn-helix domain-containing protein [Streptomyces mobaraensis]UKW28223.1 helix-turn-helix domain-containing protein [Streptomyces sp. TYQ1024]
MSAVPKPQPQQAASVTGRRGDQKQSGSTRLLGDELRRMRQERGLGLKDVAPVIRGSVSKVSRLERGESPPKERDVWDLVHFYRVPAERLRMIEELLQQTRNEEWWQQYTDVTPHFLRRLISLEGQAARIYTYETHVVPGLLQTPAYTRVLISSALHGAGETAIERRVALRQGRRAAFRAGRPRVVALLEEAVLHRLVGSPEVMREQLQYLIDIGRQEGINIRVIPFRRGADAVPLSSVTHLYFDDGGPPELVYLEHLNSAQYLTRPREIDQYRHILNRLSRYATNRVESEALLEEAITKLN